MRFTQSVALVATLTLAACSGFSESRLNPLNWFKGAGPEPLEFVQVPADARALVGQVITMKVEPYPGGAIVRATGLPASQGWWDAELVKVDSAEEGVILYEFRIFPPPTPRPAGTPYSRQVTVAAAISDIALQGVGKIVVQGAANALSSRR